MRSGKFFFVAGLVVMFALIGLIIGCSSNKDASPVSGLSEADIQYSAVTAEVNQFVDSTVAQFVGGLDIALQDDQNGQTDIITGAYSSQNPDSVVTNGGWHVVYSSDVVAGYNAFLIDSIQFQHLLIPQDKRAGADAMVVSHHFSVTNPDTTVDYRNNDVQSTLRFNGINLSSATINGIRTQIVTVKTDFTKRTFNIQMVVSGVTVPKANNGWVKGCPASGLIQGSVDYTIQRGSSVPTTTTWNYSITIDNGTATATVVAGAYSKSYTAPVCTM
jgi:hypothetical protein